MKKRHGLFVYIGETSKWQILQYNMHKRKSITLKNGVKWTRLKNGHTVYCNNHKKMRTDEYMFVDGKFRAVTPRPKYVGIDAGKDEGTNACKIQL